MKKRILDEYRQTKEYDGRSAWTPSPGFIKAQEEAKDHLEKCHQKLWGESYYNDPSEYDGDIHQEELDKAAAEGSTKHFPKKECPLDPVEEAKIEIVDKVTKHFQDMLFEMICEEMSNRYVFQSQEYLTAAGHELFEEEFFEFYHEHHGEILYKVMKNITNG